MATLRDLIAVPPVAPGLTALVEIGLDNCVTSIHLAEGREQIAGANSGALIVLLDDELDRAPSYYLDVVLREAAERDASALVLRSSRPDLVGATGISLARRARLAVLALDPGAELGQFVIAVHRQIQPDADASLTRLDGLRQLLQNADDRLAPNALMQLINEGGLRFRLTSQDDHAGTPIACDGTVERRVIGECANPTEQALAECLVAEALARATLRARHLEESSIRSRSELLGELLTSEPDDTPPLVRRARQLGLAIDGWHAIIAIAPDLSPGLDPLAWQEQLDHLGRLAADTARASGGSWHRARIAEHLLLVLLEREDPGGQANAAVVRTTRRVIERLRAAEPDLRFFCGVSAVHPGATGLWSCLLEARTAARAARLDGEPARPVFFDATGVNQTIAEWYGTEAARKRVSALLAPLDELEPRRRDEGLQTLRSYLDHDCSASRTADALFLHRNTVTYRIQRLTETLNVDLADPDERLLLELACRAQQLTTAQPGR